MSIYYLTSMKTIFIVSRKPDFTASRLMEKPALMSHGYICCGIYRLFEMVDYDYCGRFDLTGVDSEGDLYYFEKNNISGLFFPAIICSFPCFLLLGYADYPKRFSPLPDLSRQPVTAGLSPLSFLLT